MYARDLSLTSYRCNCTYMNKKTQPPLPRAIATVEERFPSRPEYASAPSEPVIFFCACRQTGSAAFSNARPFAVRLTARVRRSSPATIRTHPRFSRGPRSRLRVVRSITSRAANSLILIGPRCSICASTVNCVARKPKGCNAPSYICVTARAAFRKLKQAQGLHSDKSNCSLRLAIK